MSAGKRIVVLASAVAPFGTGPTGGVSRYAVALSRAIQLLGSTPHLVLPHPPPKEPVPTEFEHSAVSGTYQPTGTSAAREHWPAGADGLLGNMLRFAAVELEQGRASLAINLNHDWLPYWLSPLFPGRLLHVANLTVSDAATTAELLAQHARAPGTVACLGETHRQILGLADAPLLPCGLDPDTWPLGRGAGGYIAFCGRLAPEKGVLDAARAAQIAGRELRIAGAPDDPVWWREEWPRIDAAGARQVGFLAGSDLVQFLGDAECLVMAQRWQEAFGIAMAEALLCGTPIAAVPRGANLEMVREGMTGALAEESTPEALATAINLATGLDRGRVRDAALAAFSLPSMAATLARWLDLN